jgi:hypothetical protein
MLICSRGKHYFKRCDHCVLHPEVPGEVEAVEAGHPAVVDDQVRGDLRLAFGEALVGGDAVVGRLAPVGEGDVLGDELVAGEGDEAGDGADAGGVDRLAGLEAVIDQQDQAGATVEALELDDLGEGVVELKFIQRIDRAALQMFAAEAATCTMAWRPPQIQALEPCVQSRRARGNRRRSGSQGLTSRRD